MSTRTKMESAAKITLNKQNKGRKQVLIDTITEPGKNARCM